jgi:hypothetical protein
MPFMLGDMSVAVFFRERRLSEGVCRGVKRPPASDVLRPLPAGAMRVPGHREPLPVVFPLGAKVVLKVASSVIDSRPWDSAALTFIKRAATSITKSASRGRETQNIALGALIYAQRPKIGIAATGATIVVQNSN